MKQSVYSRLQPEPTPCEGLFVHALTSLFEIFKASITAVWGKSYTQKTRTSIKCPFKMMKTTARCVFPTRFFESVEFMLISSRWFCKFSRKETKPIKI